MESKIFAKLNFDPGILVILSLILAIAAIVLVIMLFLKQSRLEANYKIFMKGKNAKTLEEAFKSKFEDIELVREQTDLLHKRMMYVEKSLNKSYQKCSHSRYQKYWPIFFYCLFHLIPPMPSNNCLLKKGGTVSSLFNYWLFYQAS